MVVKVTKVNNSNSNSNNKNSKIKFVVAIPTYKRYQILLENTLQVLKDHDILVNNIYIFVANKKEHKEYSKYLPKIYHNNIIIGKIGLKNQRNFITNYFPENTKILQMDDDVKGIFEIINKENPNNYKKVNQYRKHNKLIPIKNLNLFITNAFIHCQKNGIYLWGIYPVANPYFMHFTKSENLKFIVGPMFGIINRHDYDLTLTIDEKENTERTLKYYVKDGKLLRYNNVTIKTNYYKNKGGMQEFNRNRISNSKKSANYLHKKYPHLTKIKVRKTTGITEVLLRNSNQTKKK